MRPDELAKDWDPAKDKRLTVWEMTHHLLRVYFIEKAGDMETAELLRKIGLQSRYIAAISPTACSNLCEKKSVRRSAQAYTACSCLAGPRIAPPST